MQSIRSLSLIIPVYCSEENLQSHIRLVYSELSSIEKEFEIILVDDGSIDNSWQIIEALASEIPEVRGIKMRRNFGQHNALLCGIRDAENEIIITMDDDGQHPVSEIVNLLEELENGFDVVYATPISENHGFIRDLASTSVKWVLESLMNVPSAANVSAYRAFRTDLRDGFARFEGPLVNIDIMLTWATNRFSSIRAQYWTELVVFQVTQRESL